MMQTQDSRGAMGRSTRPGPAMLLGLAAACSLWPDGALAQGTWTTTGRLAQHREYHTATLLPSGKVLVAGGQGLGGDLSSAELYDVATGTWTTTGSLNTPRGRHTATLLPNGKVLVAGGSAGTSAELYDPAMETWTSTGSLSTSRHVGHTATLLLNGKVLVIGGSGDSSAELYDPATGTWATTGSLAVARVNHTATLLGSGDVLVVGGVDAGGSPLVEVYDPARETWRLAATLHPLTGHTATLLAGGRVLVVGGVVPFGHHRQAWLYDQAMETWTMTGLLATARGEHAATLLPSGRVLVAGGRSNSPNGYEASAELYDPLTETWTTAGSLATERIGDTATLLPNGKVLVAGGSGDGGPLASTELYDDPSTTSWTTADSLATARGVHTATLLPSGKVLVTGGFSLVPAGERLTPLSSAELYDPATETWTPTGSLITARSGHTATLLPSGKVLVAGGNAGAPLSSAELYDPLTETWTTTGSLAAGRYGHTATLLASGRVLVTGGFGLVPEGGYMPLGSAELYDPATETWTPTGSLIRFRGGHTATLLPSGKVLVAGGNDPSAELYDPATETWTPTSSLITRRSGHTATLLPSGSVLVTGGNAGSLNYLSSAELYEPATGTWTTTGSLMWERTLHTATLLPSGDVLVAGGHVGDFFPVALDLAELYDPTAGTWTATTPLATERFGHTATLMLNGRVLVAAGFRDALAAAEQYNVSSFVGAAPVLTSVSTPLAYGTPVVVTGIMLRGISESSDGITQNSAVNYPLFQMRSVESGRVSWLVPDPLSSFTDEEMTVTFSSLPPTLDPGWNYLFPVRAGIVGEARLVQLACSLSITAAPKDQDVAIGERAMFTVGTQGGRHYQWQKNPGTGWVPIGGDQPTYVTEPVAGSETGTRYRVVVEGACASDESDEAVLTIKDTVPPAVSVVSPSGGEYWLLSTPGQSPSEGLVTWAMEDDVRICRVEVRLLFSTDGGMTYSAVPRNVNFDPDHPQGTKVFGREGACTLAEQVTATSLSYAIPVTFPSGVTGSLYKVEVRVVDHAGLELPTPATSRNPFYIVRSNPDSVRTLILHNVSRMQDPGVMGISTPQAQALRLKLQELANHPRVQGLLVDLGGISALTSFYAAWDADPSSTARANEVLFGLSECTVPACDPKTNGIHAVVRTLLTAYGGVRHVVLVGDDRVLPLARMRDRTRLLDESVYVAPGNLTATTRVGMALAANTYLSDDPLTVKDEVRPGDLSAGLFTPDLAVGRLVETPEEITTTIATFISQDGVLDLTTLPNKVLVTGYDFLSDSAFQIWKQWETALGQCRSETPDTPPRLECGAFDERGEYDADLTPVNGAFLGGRWPPTLRAEALKDALDGGDPYPLASLSGHATHFAEGVPGASPTQIVGLETADMLDLNLSGGVVYAVGCHGGLPVPGSDPHDADHSLDLPQAFLSRGVVAYIANTGYGWGLTNGIGYAERLVQLFTEELSRGGTQAVGEVVKRAKQRYVLETPRYDAYDEKSLMQWTLFGLPMYAVAVGGTTSAPEMRPLESHGTETYGPVRVTRRRVSGGNEGTSLLAPEPLPVYLTQLNLHFDFSAPEVYQKWSAGGDELPNAPGCPDDQGCYYTLNGLVERSTGAGDLPVQPYFIYDSRLSGTSQHGVLWKGGQYFEETGWKPVIGQLASNADSSTDHGSAPETIKQRSTSVRVVPGADPEDCRPSDLELNSLVVDAGEARKAAGTDPRYDAELYTIERTYRTVDLEVFYFNDRTKPKNNCDRTEPELRPSQESAFGGKYHRLQPGGLLEWRVLARDASEVWRAIVVVTDNTAVDGQGRWEAVELERVGTEELGGTTWTVWTGSKVVGSRQATYLVQAVDGRGNVGWLTYQSADIPASGVSLGVAETVEVRARRRLRSQPRRNR